MDESSLLGKSFFGESMNSIPITNQRKFINTNKNQKVSQYPPTNANANVKSNLFLSQINTTSKSPFKVKNRPKAAVDSINIRNFSNFSNLHNLNSTSTTNDQLLFLTTGKWNHTKTNLNINSDSELDMLKNEKQYLLTSMNQNELKYNSLLKKEILKKIKEKEKDKLSKYFLLKQQKAKEKLYR